MTQEKRSTQPFAGLSVNTQTYVTVTSDGERHFPSADDAEAIFRHLDMQDCHDMTMRAWRVTDGGDLEPVTLRGPWHDADDPLKLAIVSATGEVLATGYGTDH